MLRILQVPHEIVQKRESLHINSDTVPASDRPDYRRICGNLSVPDGFLHTPIGCDTGKGILTMTNVFVHGESEHIHSSLSFVYLFSTIGLVYFANENGAALGSAVKGGDFPLTGTMLQT